MYIKLYCVEMVVRVVHYTVHTGKHPKKMICAQGCRDRARTAGLSRKYTLCMCGAVRGCHML